MSTGSPPEPLTSLAASPGYADPPCAARSRRARAAQGGRRRAQTDPPWHRGRPMSPVGSSIDRSAATEAVGHAACSGPLLSSWKKPPAANSFLLAASRGLRRASTERAGASGLAPGGVGRSDRPSRHLPGSGCRSLNSTGMSFDAGDACAFGVRRHPATARAGGPLDYGEVPSLQPQPRQGGLGDPSVFLRSHH